MRNNDPKCKSSLGFLTVIDYPEQGLFGGLLLLNLAGRPLEFHCTAPVRPNRAQQILYGATLEPYLFGEQIGQTLLAKSKVSPTVVCTDREGVLAVRDFVEMPVALVMPNGNTSSSEETKPQSADEATASYRVDGSHPRGTRLPTFRLGRHQLATWPTAADDPAQIAKRLGELADGLDLLEPFGRIREAIEEARRGG